LRETIDCWGGCRYVQPNVAAAAGVFFFEGERRQGFVNKIETFTASTKDNDPTR